MPVEIPATHRDLLTKKTFAHLATTMADGSPQVTPVWFDTDGPYLRVNSAVGRLKGKNIRRDPRVALSILDPDDAYRYLEIRGHVVAITENGGAAPSTPWQTNTWAWIPTRSTNRPSLA